MLLNAMVGGVEGSVIISLVVLYSSYFPSAGAVS